MPKLLEVRLCPVRIASKDCALDGQARENVRPGQTSKQVRVSDSRENGGALKNGNARPAGRMPRTNFQSWKEYRRELDGKPADFKTAAEVQQGIDKFEMDLRHDNTSTVIPAGEARLPFSCCA